MTHTPDPHAGQDHDDDVAGPAEGPAPQEPPREPPPAASVAEEAALLIELLSRGGSSGPSGTPPPGSRTDDPTDVPRQDAPGSRTDAGPGTREGGRQSGECTCGGSTPAACKVCPVCQLIAFVQQVNPDTIDRVADFVGFAATALRDLATAQRERRPEPSSEGTTDSTGTTGGTTGGTTPSGETE